MKHAWLVALMLPAMAGAAPANYATQWPLILGSDDAGAYRVALDESVYRQLQTPDLRDLDVLNNDGAPVPTSVLDPEQPLAQPVRSAPVPWFALPAPDSPTAGTDWRLISQVDSDGRLRRIEVESGAPVAASSRTGLLLDLSRVREPVVALELQWKPLEALDLGYRVEASDDLETWRVLPSRGRLVDLSREERRLLHRRIQLYGLLPHHQRARYLRLTPDAGGAPLEITAVTAEFAGATAQAPQWLALQPSGSASGGTGGDASVSAVFEYDMEGRFPVQQVDVAMPGNHALEWRLESRDSADDDWRLRAGPWMAFQLNEAGQDRQSAPRVLGRTVRDRYWRLRASGPVPGASPTLRLGYRPEVVVFLAQGAPPYRLVAGSAQARRADSPLPELVSTLRGQSRPDWQPAPAYLEPPRVLAGQAALTPARDWKSWLLWGVLALGAAVVAAFALSLLRGQRPPAG